MLITLNRSLVSVHPDDRVADVADILTRGEGVISVPTIVTCGAFDEATPPSTERFATMIPRAAFETFANASHRAFIEHRTAYIARLHAFLDGQK